VEAKLEKIVDSGKDEKKDEVIGLIRNWTKRHAVRIVFTAMGGFLTLWAAVSD
jgi:hypothetical protein